MKTLVKNCRLLPLFCLLCACTTISGCKKMGIKRKLSIEVTAYFNSNNIKICLDKDEVYSGIVTTSGLTAVADIVQFDYPIGSYKLTVSLDGVETMKKIRHKKDMHIVISRDYNTGKIIISQYTGNLKIYEG